MRTKFTENGIRGHRHTNIRTSAAMTDINDDDNDSATLATTVIITVVSS